MVNCYKQNEATELIVEHATAKDRKRSEPAVMHTLVMRARMGKREEKEKTVEAGSKRGRSESRIGEGVPSAEAALMDAVAS